MEEKDKNQQKKLKKAILKKALGYDCTEIVEEYVSGDEGEIRLAKKKITKKNVPPDMTALKMLVEDRESPIELMTDEELEEEKLRLLKLLAEENIIKE